jgi:hypothetical protein
MLQKDDFIWKEHHENNIADNPLGEYYCIVDCGNYARKYSIVPQYPSKDGFCINMSEAPEYYILFEARGNKASDEERQKTFYEMCHFDDYVFEHESFIRVFKTLDEAKDRAYVQYRAIFGYVLPHIEKDVNSATKHHFVVK